MLSLDRLDAIWTSPQPEGDESLTPPGYYLCGDGRCMTYADSWLLAANTLYFHQTDWIDPKDNGNGMQVTCCGFRPYDEQAFNLSCPNGHLLGYLYTDCCAPQGVHVPAANVQRFAST